VHARTHTHADVQHNNTALHTAVVYNHCGALKELLDYGVPVNVPNTVRAHSHMRSCIPHLGRQHTTAYCVQCQSGEVVQMVDQIWCIHIHSQ
jgi:ankyrin repeat protein